MKPTIAIAASLLSFAAGWLLKPSTDSTGTEADVASSATRSLRSGGSAAASGLDGKSHIRELRSLPAPPQTRVRPESEREAHHAQTRFQETFGSAAERAERARLARFTEALGLDADQRATLAALLNNRRDGFRDLQGAGQTPADSIQLAALAEQNFLEEVKKLLDPEQTTALEELKERERENQVEARAQRELADLIGMVDLSEQQRQQALQALRSQSAAAVARRPAGWALMNEGRGIVSANQAAALDELGGVMDDPSIINDPQEIHRRLVEARRQDMAQKVAALSGILTPGQISQYRATLDGRTLLMEQFVPPAVKPR